MKTYQPERGMMKEGDKFLRIEYLKGIIKALTEDIEIFGPAGDDLARLNAYKKELEQLTNQKKES